MQEGNGSTAFGNLAGSTKQESPMPTKGRIVLFTFDEFSAQQALELGCTLVKAGDTTPAIVVRTWGGSCLNLKVFLDGPNDMWVTSVSHKNESLETRCWEFPPRV